MDEEPQQSGSQLSDVKDLVGLVETEDSSGPHEIHDKTVAILNPAEGQEACGEALNATTNNESLVEKSATVLQPSTRRSTRVRNPSSKTAITKTQEDSDAEYSPSGKQNKKRLTGANKSTGVGRQRKRARKDIWDPEHVLQDPNSPLAFCDLRSIVTNPHAWDVLSSEEKAELLALLPQRALTPDREVGDGNVVPLRPSTIFLEYDEGFRSHVSLFQEDIREGRYDSEWLRQAQHAHEQRAEGIFDTFKEKEFEEFWGQKQKTSYSATLEAGADGGIASIGLKELVEDGVLKQGDILRFGKTYQKKIKKKTQKVLIEKEVMFLGASAKSGEEGSSLHFEISMPPGQNVMSSPHLREDVVKTGIDPATIAEEIVKEDGRWEGKVSISGAAAVEMWKHFRVSKDNHELGTLWDMRLRLYEQKLALETEKTSGHSNQNGESSEKAKKTIGTEDHCETSTSSC